MIDSTALVYIGNFFNISRLIFCMTASTNTAKENLWFGSQKEKEVRIPLCKAFVHLSVDNLNIMVQDKTVLT